MKKTIIYSLIATFYLLTPVFVIAILGTAVSKKYEVDESYWRIDADSKLTSEQRKVKTKQLDNEGKRLDNRITFFAIAGLTSFIIATKILVKWRTLTMTKKAAHNIVLAKAGVNTPET